MPRRSRELPMAKIFLSYRRQESTGVAGRIYDRLRSHFGDAGVFMDVQFHPLRRGIFVSTSPPSSSKCDVMVVVIGRRLGRWRPAQLVGSTTRRLASDPSTARDGEAGRAGRNVGFRVAAVQE